MDLQDAMNDTLGLQFEQNVANATVSFNTTSTSAASTGADPQASAEASSDGPSIPTVALEFRRSKSMFLLLVDGCAKTGGFAFFCYLLFGVLVSSCNRQLYLKKVIEESFLVKKNEDFHGSGAGSLGNKKSSSKAGDRKNAYASPR